jgi:hypothetical protein
MREYDSDGSRIREVSGDEGVRDSQVAPEVFGIEALIWRGQFHRA